MSEILEEEFSDDIMIVAEEEIIGEGENAKKQICFKGVFSEADSLNRNKRVYPKDVLRTVYEEAIHRSKTTGKPIYVYQGPMAASGGYYISCAADQIYANRNTLTGCIGVISGTTFDMSEFLNNLGIKAETIHSGKNKNMMNFNEPFTDEQKDIMQSISDECYEQFVSIVANARKMSYKQAADLSDGRLYTAKQALENGLIDRIDSWENMIEHLSEKIEKPGIKVKTFKKERKTNFFDLVTGKAKQLSDMIVAEKIGLPVEIVNQMNEKRIEPKYLFPGY